MKDMICYHCRKKIPDGSKYCPECGAATKLVTDAPTETIILPPDLEELEPAPAPVKPERRLEFPKVELPRAKPEKKAAPQEIADTEPRKPGRKLQLTAAAVLVVLLAALMFGMRGGADRPETPAEPPAMQPIEFADAALWHAERGENFPFTHAFDAYSYGGCVLQDYSQKYMEPAEAAALFETYFTDYLTGELGFVRTGERTVEMSTLPWQYVWFEHPDARVTNFAASEMNSAIGDGSCDLAYAFQYGTDGNLLVTCYFSPLLTMQKGELPPVEQLPARMEFTDPALWFAEQRRADRLWRSGAVEKTPGSYKQEYEVSERLFSTADDLLEEYIRKCLTAKQEFEMVDSLKKTVGSVKLGIYWFDYTGERAPEGFRYDNQTASLTVSNCDLVLGYYDRGDSGIEVYCYYDKELVPRESDLLDNTGGETVPDDAVSNEKPVRPADLPAGAVPELGAFSGGMLTAASTTETDLYTRVTYEGTVDRLMWEEYVDLLRSSYDFTMEKRDVVDRYMIKRSTFGLRYRGDAAVKTFENDEEKLNLLIRAQVFGGEMSIEVSYANGLTCMDTGDRSQYIN